MDQDLVSLEGVYDCHEDFIRAQLKMMRERADKMRAGAPQGPDGTFTPAQLRDLIKQTGIKTPTEKMFDSVNYYFDKYKNHILVASWAVTVYLCYEFDTYTPLVTMGTGLLFKSF